MQEMYVNCAGARRLLQLLPELVHGEHLQTPHSFPQGRICLNKVKYICIFFQSK